MPTVQVFPQGKPRVRQMLADEVTVLVWHNHKVSKLLSSGHFGHAALMLRSDKIPEMSKRDFSAERERIAELKEKWLALRGEIDKLKQDITRTKGQLASAGGGAYGRSLQADIDTANDEVNEKTGNCQKLMTQAKGVSDRIKFWDNPPIIRWYYLSEPDQGTFRYVYISWWPKSGMDMTSMKTALKDMRSPVEFRKDRTPWKDMAGELSYRAEQMLLGGSDPRPGQVGVSEQYSLGYDDDFWGQEPDWVIAVPAVGAANRFWGMNAARMWSWFEDYRESAEAEYKMISTTKSCAGLAMRALSEGGSDAFIKQPLSHWYILPNEVAQYGMDLRAALVDLNTRTLRFEIQVLQPWMARRSPSNARPQRKPDLWGVEQWKENRGGHHVGRFSVADTLQKYHATDSSRDWNTRFSLLVSLANYIFEQFDDRRQGMPLSKRDEALTILGAQILNLLRDPTSWVCRG